MRSSVCPACGLAHAQLRCSARERRLTMIRFTAAIGGRAARFAPASMLSTMNCGASFGCPSPICLRSLPTTRTRFGGACCGLRRRNRRRRHERAFVVVLNEVAVEDRLVRERLLPAAVEPEPHAVDAALQQWQPSFLVPQA